MGIVKGYANVADANPAKAAPKAKTAGVNPFTQGVKSTGSSAKPSAVKAGAAKGVVGPSATAPRVKGYPRVGNH
jgi:hypothetical protein